MSLPPTLPHHLTRYRFSYGVSSRLQRIHPTEAMQFHDWEIPAGVSLLFYSCYTAADDEMCILDPSWDDLGTRPS